MLVTIYYPFTDERSLFPDRTRLVESRFTRLGETHRFSRNLGELIDRPKGGFQGWIGENTICAMHRSVAIDLTQPATIPLAESGSTVAFKRLFFDGLRGYFSIGISLPESFAPDPQISRIADLLTMLAAVPVSSPHRPQRDATLQDFSKLARDLYASGSVRKLTDLSKSDYQKHIHFTKPMIIVSMIGGAHRAASELYHPLALKLQSPSQAAALGQHTYGGFMNWPTSTFLLVIASANQTDAANSRFLRVGVARLYLETYALERMIGLLQSRLFEQCDDEGRMIVASTVNESLRRLHGAARPAITDSSESYDALVASFARIFRPGHVSDLGNIVTRLQARPNLRKALERSMLIDGASSITAITKLEFNVNNSINISDNSGNIGNVVGGNIENSGVTAGNQSITYSQEQITNAFATVADAIAQAPSNKAQAAQQKLSELKEEAAKGKEAKDSLLAKLVDGLVELVPTAVSAVVSAFGTPILGGIAGPATKYVLEKIQGK